MANQEPIRQLYAPGEPLQDSQQENPQNDEQNPEYSIFGGEKRKLEPGVVYEGKFLINEYGNISVWPKKEKKTKGSGVFKVVSKNEALNYTIEESINYYKVTLSLPKTGLSVRSILSVFSSLQMDLRNFV